MAEFDYQEDDFASEMAEPARELFARTVAGTRPLVGFTAEDVVLGGRQRVRRRRLAAVVGGTASVAAIAVAATAFAGGQRSVAASVAPGSSAQSTASSAAHSSAAPLTDAEHTVVENHLASAVFTKIFDELDPGHNHLSKTVLPDGRMTPNKPIGAQCVEKTKLQTGYVQFPDWTVDGKSPFPRSKDDTTPWIQISVTLTAPGQGADEFSDTKDWTQITTSDLADGSVLRAYTASDGHRLQVVRTMKNQQLIALGLEDSSAFLHNPESPTPPMNPFPFTVGQLSGIVSGLSLPLPFADGFQPHIPCP